MAKPPSELLEPLRRFEPGTQSIFIAARSVVLDVIGACHELIFPIRKIVSVIYSTTEKRMKDNICLLVVYHDHVNLMFPRGVDLNDPKGLLKGSGTTMRCDDAEIEAGGEERAVVAAIILRRHAAVPFDRGPHF